MHLAKHRFCFGDAASSMFLFLQLMDFQISFLNLLAGCAQSPAAVGRASMAYGSDNPNFPLFWERNENPIQMSLVKISSYFTLHREAWETVKCDHKEHSLVMEISVQGNQGHFLVPGTKSLTFSQFMGFFFSLLQQRTLLALLVFCFFQGVSMDHTSKSLSSTEKSWHIFLKKKKYTKIG